MICIYCEDLTTRSQYQHYFKDRGILVEAPPPALFPETANAPECRAVVIIGRCDGTVISFLRRTLPLFVVGKGNDPGIAYFDSYDDPELIVALNMISRNLYPFRVGQLLYCGNEKDDPVFLAGYPVSLTPTEKSFLAFLVANKDREVSGEELLEFCVGDVHRRTGNVPQHISSINKKSALITGRTLILSDKNGNYKLNPDA